MSIPIAIPSEVSKWAFYLGSEIKKLPLEAILASCTGVESIFYTSLNVNSSNTPKLVKFIREQSVAYINEIQTVFNAVNMGANLLISMKLMNEINKKYSISRIKMAGTFFTLFVISNFFIWRHYRDSVLETKDQIQVSTSRRVQQKIAQTIHLTHIILNLALTYFSQGRFWCLFNAVGSGYSFWKNSQVKWLSFSRTFTFSNRKDNFPSLPMFSRIRISETKITYNMIVLPHSGNEVDCSICLDEGASNAFCINHLFHQNCLIDLVTTKSESFANSAMYIRKDTNRYTNGAYTGTTRTYSVDIPQENLPSCPNCRDFPLQNYCEILVTDADYGKFNATVNITGRNFNRQPLFERLYLAYNIAQAGLSYLQKYPELAATIYKIQQFIMVFDIAGLASTIYFLHERMREKFREMDTAQFEIFAAFTGVALAALSYLAVLAINSYSRPNLILKDILGNLQISPEILQKTKISWGSPLVYQAMQWLYLCRMVTSFALSFFSKNQTLCLLSGAAQSFSLFNISKLRWIKFVQDLEWPLKKVVSAEGKLDPSVNQTSLKNLTINSEFMVHPPCLNEPTHLQSTVKSIYDYMDKLFQKSFWKRYWTIYMTNGVETKREMTYSVDLVNSSLPPCACTLEPHLINIWLTGVDATYGWVKINRDFK
ncbi:MAG: hypothetical protein L0207_00310 [Chlamydiae bacterium]|nr:hypothetical protein [Chlamydiota bacterium]